MDDFRNLLNDNNELIEESQVPFTPTPQSTRDSASVQPQAQCSSSSLKRSRSQTPWDPLSQSSFSKRGRTSGSASSIQGLFEDHNFDSSSAQAVKLTESIEHTAFAKHGQSMERLAKVAEKMGTSIYGQQPTQTIFTPEEVKKKS
ncbi:uncharacterized protein MELLADRAFT_56796, partial [Melampsora larici-populina 98AG31]